jgi:RNA polymerase sigma-70 factor (ECF subfamily)
VAAFLRRELHPQSAAASDWDALSVEEVYRTHVSEVSRWAARLGGPAIELEDAVQEVFEIVQRELPGFRGEARLTTWLYRITENVVRHQRRRGPLADERRRRAREHELVSSERTPPEKLEGREAEALVYRALDRMNERYRTAIILFEIEDLSGEEVAERMGLGLANLWVVLHRARAQLVQRLAELQEAKR